MKMNKYTATLLVLGVLIFTGCSDRRELSNVAIILAAGIEKVNNDIQVTLQVAIPTSKSDVSGSSGQKKPYFIESATGRNIIEAVQNIQNHMSRILRFSHRRVLLIHENIAKKDITDVLDFVNRYQDSRLSTQIYITKSSIKDILSSHTELEQITGEYIREVGIITGYSETAREFISNINQSKDPVAPFISYA
ncbi:hypothetical protein AB4Z22_35840, partial [Paenibacillus sp. TAF58]